MWVDFVVDVESEGGEDTHGALVVTVVTAARDTAVDTEPEDGRRRAGTW